jgi:hypothetical protein
VTMTLEEAMAEGRRRDAADQKWLGETTRDRPTFTEAQLLDQQGIPSCHAWQVPIGDIPAHLDATAALRRWQDGACAMCSARPERLLVDHCHQSGLIRGLLCTSCNTAEGLQDAPAFIAYRERPPALMLGIEEQYGAAWDGFASTAADRTERNAVHVDAAEALFGDITDRFRSAPEGEQ